MQAVDEAYKKQREAEKQLRSLKYQAEQNRKIAEKEVQKLNWIMVEFEEENPVFPYISDINDIETEAGDIVRNISVNIRFYEGWDE